jgi:hypothetical protein
MKTWSIIIATFYGVIIAALLPPLAYFILGKDLIDFSEYFSSGFWIYVLFIVAGQILLILVPVDISDRKKVHRKKLWMPLITSALLLSILVFMGFISLLTAFQGDELFGSLKENQIGIMILVVILSFWAFWSILFYRHLKKGDPEKVFSKFIHWLIKGSILELLIAVPCHIIVRQRDECCADGFTFLGIVTGISVMLMSFGPGIIFLYAKRIKSRKT